MAWAKIDDQFFYNKKIAQVDGPAKLLYLAGLVYVANQLTDGFIPERAVKFIASTADVANCQDFARQLLDVCLWEATEGGYIIHDYLEWNPSKTQVEHNREVRAEAGRQGGLAKAENVAKSQQIASGLLSKSLANDWQNSAPSPSPSPSPWPVPESCAAGEESGKGKPFAATPPTPASPSKAAVKPETQPAPKAPSVQQEMFGALETTCGLNGKIKVIAGRIGKSASSLLAAGHTPAQVLAFRAWWQANDWRAKDSPYPSLAQVEEKIQQAQLPTPPNRGNGTGHAPAVKEHPMQAAIRMAMEENAAYEREHATHPN